MLRREHEVCIASLDSQNRLGEVQRAPQIASRPPAYLITMEKTKAIAAVLCKDCVPRYRTDCATDYRALLASETKSWFQDFNVREDRFTFFGREIQRGCQSGISEVLLLDRELQHFTAVTYRRYRYVERQLKLVAEASGSLPACLIIENFVIIVWPFRVHCVFLDCQGSPAYTAETLEQHGLEFRRLSKVLVVKPVPSSDIRRIFFETIFSSAFVLSP